MNIFGEIMSKVFGAKESAAANASQPTQTSTPSPLQTPSQTAAPAASGTPVDVNAVLTQMAQKKGEKLNWQTSIVDLMKLLDMDSSLTARKQLAKELNYTGDTNDSAQMNIWLQKEVLKRFAANGGKVPSDLLH